MKAKDEIAATALPVKTGKDRYAGAVWSVEVRTLHEVFEADRAGKIHSVTLTVGVDRDAPATENHHQLCATWSRARSSSRRPPGKPQRAHTDDHGPSGTQATPVTAPAPRLMAIPDRACAGVTGPRGAPSVGEETSRAARRRRRRRRCAHLAAPAEPLQTRHRGRR